MKRLLTVWGCIFVLHAAMTILAGIVDTRPAARVVFIFLDGFHLLFVNLLALLGAADLERRLSPQEALPPAMPARYEGSGLTAADRAAMFRRAETVLSDEALYLKPDLTLRDLAEAAGAAPRDISEAINGAGEQSFYDLVNAARIRHAQTLLVASPETRILDIAFQSGFNSKSAFNDAFKKTAGVTPSEYRRRRTSTPETVPPNAKNDVGAVLTHASGRPGRRKLLLILLILLRKENQNEGNTHTGVCRPPSHDRRLGP